MMKDSESLLSLRQWLWEFDLHLEHGMCHLVSHSADDSLARIESNLLSVLGVQLLCSAPFWPSVPQLELPASISLPDIGLLSFLATGLYLAIQTSHNKQSLLGYQESKLKKFQPNKKFSVPWCFTSTHHLGPFPRPFMVFLPHVLPGSGTEPWVLRLGPWSTLFLADPGSGPSTGTSLLALCGSNYRLLLLSVLL